jgi:O-acetylserine/cysteine efflux transporter
VIEPLHLALVLFVVVNWGVSFVVIHVGLGDVPPLLLAALRFALAAVPLVFFVARPKAVRWTWFAAYGVATGVVQFGVAFTAIKLGVSPGLASLVIQMNAFFTVLLSSLFFAEHLRAFQWLGLGVAFCGIGLIGVSGGGDAPLIGVVLMLVAALGWALANLTVKRVSQLHPGINLFAFSVHANAYAPLPLLALSLAIEGVPRDLNALTHLSLASVGSVAYLAFIATVLCFGAWAWLMGKYSAARVAPFSLLVPVFGMLSSAVLLGEALTGMKILAAGLVVLGLVINVFGARLTAPVKGLS